MNKSYIRASLHHRNIGNTSSLFQKLNVPLAFHFAEKKVSANSFSELLIKTLPFKIQNKYILCFLFISFVTCNQYNC